MNQTTRYLPFVGRVLIGAIFLMSGLTKLPAYAHVTTAIAQVGLPFPPLGWAISILVEAGCGVLMLIGFQTRVIAAVLAAWCVLTAAFFHNNFADQNMMIHFLKNIMLAGGLLQIVHFGAGAISLDNRRASPVVQPVANHA